MRDRFAGVEGRSLRAVRRGEGKVIELDGQKVAAYRDASGATTVRSAVCTHMGCLVHGTAPSGPGTVRAMDRASSRTATSSPDRRNRR